MARSKGPHKEEIKAAIRKTGITLKELSKRTGYSRWGISKSLNVPMPRANKAVADLLDRSLHSLWPHWYDQQGQRIKPKAHSKTTPKRPARHCQKSA